MSKVKFTGSNEVFEMNFKPIASNMVCIYPPFPTNNVSVGFVALSPRGKIFGDYSDFSTVYRKMEDGTILLSNDGSVYVEPTYKVHFTSNGNCTFKGDMEQTPECYENIVVPEVIPNENYEFLGWNPDIPTEGKLTDDITFTAKLQYVPTLEEVQNAKIAEMNAAQQVTIQQGLNITLSDGSVEHFTLADHDQTSLMGLQAMIAQGAENIPWHTSDQAQHCKYYSNTDIAIITAQALAYVTFHVTYFRDLRIYIRSLQSKEEIAKVYYGMYIPESCQSEVLKDCYAVQNVNEVLTNETIS